MFKKQQRGSVRIFRGFLMGVVSLALLSMNGFTAEVQRGKETEQTTGNQQQEKMSLQEGWRASKIIDYPIMNDRGEELGEVDDLIMSRNGKIKKVILNVGGFLGVGDRLVAVPFKSLQIGEEGDIVYNATKQQLEKHPVFTYKSEGFDGYYYSPPPPYGFFALPPPGYQGYFPYGHPYGSFPRSRYRGEYGAWGWEYYPERLRVSAILNRSVWNEAGQNVGEIDDLIIGRNGKVEKIILSMGGVLGMEQKLVALPFKPLKVSGAGIVCNACKQELKDRPRFRYGEK